MSQITLEEIKTAQDRFRDLIETEDTRIERMKASGGVKDFSSLEKIKVGILPGDGVGPILMKQALRVLNELVEEEIADGKIEVHEIEGMTIENRVEKMESLPKEVLEAVKKCDVLLKGPM